MIKIGDRVKFISDTGSGRVVNISGTTVEVDVLGGFVVPYAMHDLVVVSEAEEIDVMQRIGVDDEKPGRKKKAAQTTIAEPVKKKEPAYIKYGRISLVDDDYDEELLDMDKIKARYHRNLALAAEREREFEMLRIQQEEANKRITESAGATLAPLDDNPSDEKAQDEGTDKLSKVTLEELAAKIQQDKPQPTLKPKKEKKKEEIEVIDLHAHMLLDSTAGMGAGDIIKAQLARFTLSLDLCVNSSKHGKIVFIHGVGSGKLRTEINKILRSQYPKLTSQDASFKEYGYGAVMIFY